MVDPVFIPIPVPSGTVHQLGDSIERVTAIPSLELLNYSPPAPLLALHLVHHHRRIHRSTYPPPQGRLSAKRVAAIGSRYIAGLSERFMSAHRGEFIAVSVDGNILALDPSIDAVMNRLRERPPMFDYYLARLGRASISETR